MCKGSWTAVARVTTRSGTVVGSDTASGSVEFDAAGQLIAVNLTALEYEEEAMIAESEIEGPALPRRPDASPAAILGVIVTKGKESRHPLHSSPQGGLPR